MAELVRTIGHGVVWATSRPSLKRAKIDVVKDIEELSTEFDRSLFGDRCSFQQTEISIEQSWPTQNIFAGVAERSDGILSKYRSVEVLFDELAMRTTGVQLGVTTEVVCPVTPDRAQRIV